MNKPFVKIVLASLSCLLVFSTIGPAYAKANTEVVENKPVQKQTSVNIVNESQIDNVEVQPYGIKTQVIKAALKHGGSALGKLIQKIPFNWAKSAGKSIEKWGYVAADVVDELTSFSETSVTLALVSAGIPPSDAALIAKFIVFFLA